MYISMRRGQWKSGSFPSFYATIYGIVPCNHVVVSRNTCLLNSQGVAAAKNTYVYVSGAMYS